MRLPTSRHPRVNTGVAMSLLSASFVVAAVNSDGFHATSVQLHDASVWTYQSDDQYVAKINTQTVEAEIGIAAEGTQGILQDGAVAYAVADGHLYLYDPVEGISQASEPLPPQLSVAVGGGVGVLLDQRYDEGEPVPFFGHPTPSGLAPAMLALKLGIDYVPMRVERLNKARFRFTFHDAVEPDPGKGDARAQALDMTARAHAHFEQWIRERPEQWLCLKRRWPRKVYEQLGLRP